jgi:hypothetical protein
MPETVSDSLQVRSTRNDSGMIDRGWVFQIGYDYTQPLLVLAPKTLTCSALTSGNLRRGQSTCARYGRARFLPVQFKSRTVISCMQFVVDSIICSC